MFIILNKQGFLFIILRKRYYICNWFLIFN